MKPFELRLTEDESGKERRLEYNRISFRAGKRTGEAGRLWLKLPKKGTIGHVVTEHIFFCESFLIQRLRKGRIRARSRRSKAGCTEALKGRRELDSHGNNPTKITWKMLERQKSYREEPRKNRGRKNFGRSKSSFKVAGSPNREGGHRQPESRRGRRLMGKNVRATTAAERF